MPSHDERPVTFAANGTRLAGILHAAHGAGPLREIGLVMVPGGLTRRVGLHRLFTTAARALGALGATVLRFDLPGVGESEGEVRWVTKTRLASLEACYLPEIQAALDSLESHSTLRVRLLLGHCNGARSAVAAAATDSRVHGVLAWGMPTGTDEGATPASWIADALDRLIERRTPALFVYGTKDPAWGGFEAFVKTPGPPRNLWTVHTIAPANHDFTAADWTREVIETSIRWMRGHWARR